MLDSKQTKLLKNCLILICKIFLKYDLLYSKRMSSKTIKMPRRRCESYKKRNNAALFFKSLFCEQIFYIIFLIKYCFIDQENYCNAD